VRYNQAVLFGVVVPRNGAQVVDLSSDGGKLDAIMDQFGVDAEGHIQ
jgi:hypothetical protein